jgi:hypothetical protein
MRRSTVLSLHHQLVFPGSTTLPPQLTYYGTHFITNVKCFIVRAPGACLRCTSSINIEGETFKQIIFEKSNCLGVKLMKCQVDEMSSWWDVKLMRYQVDEVSSWWSFKLMKCQVDEMSSWWNVKLMRCEVDEMWSWWSFKLMKCQVGWD